MLVVLLCVLLSLAALGIGYYMIFCWLTDYIIRHQ